MLTGPYNLRENNHKKPTNYSKETITWLCNVKTQTFDMLKTIHREKNILGIHHFGVSDAMLFGGANSDLLTIEKCVNTRVFRT